MKLELGVRCNETRGPLIKSGNRAKIRTLDVAKVFPFIDENHELAGYLLIPLPLPSLVVCDEFEHKINTEKWGGDLIANRN